MYRLPARCPDPARSLPILCLSIWRSNLHPPVQARQQQKLAEAERKRRQQSLALTAGPDEILLNSRAGTPPKPAKGGWWGAVEVVGMVRGGERERARGKEASDLRG